MGALAGLIILLSAFVTIVSIIDAELKVTEDIDADSDDESDDIDAKSDDESEVIDAESDDESEVIVVKSDAELKVTEDIDAESDDESDVSDAVTDAGVANPDPPVILTVPDIDNVVPSQTSLSFSENFPELSK